MNAKHIKIQILSLMTLTVILGSLPSLSLANVISSLSSLEPERLGEGFVSTIALSPDGTVIAAAHKTNTAGFLWQTHTIFLWDPQTHEQIGELPVGNVRSMAFSPDGTLLALGAGNHTIYLWDVAERRQLGVINSPGPYSVQYVAFSPDGMLLGSSVDSDTSIHLWDVQSRSHVGALNGRAWSVAFSPNGRLIVTGGNRSDPRIKIWDAESQTQVGTLTGHLDITYDLTFSPDGNILASAGGSWDMAAFLWDIQEQTQVGLLGGHPLHVRSVAFSPDGKLLATTSAQAEVVFLWDVQTQTQLGQLKDHDISSIPNWGHEVVFDPDGKWLACSSANGVENWDLAQPSVFDFNADGAVDIDDLLRLIESWSLDDPLVDIGPMPWGDGIIDSRDLLVMAEYMVEYESDTSGLE
jgi:WD40 repeat protein